MKLEVKSGEELWKESKIGAFVGENVCRLVYDNRCTILHCTSIRQKCVCVCNDNARKKAMYFGMFNGVNNKKRNKECSLRVGIPTISK